MAPDRSPSEDKAADRSVKSAERVVVLLDTLAHSPPGLSFSELLVRSEIPRSSLHGLLKTLLKRRIIAFDERSKRYVMGTKLWELAMAYTRQLQIVPLAWPYIEDLSQRVDETVQMAVLDGADVVYVAKVESRRPLQLVSHIGSRLPAYATALGKALLAGLSPSGLMQIFPQESLETFTPRTIATRTDLMRELADIRARGFARDEGEYSAEVRCIAAPIVGHQGHVVASVSVSTPAERYEPERESEMRTHLLSCVEQISGRLGAVDAGAWRKAAP